MIAFAFTTSNWLKLDPYFLQLQYNPETLVSALYGVWWYSPRQCRFPMCVYYMYCQYVCFECFLFCIFCVSSATVLVLFSCMSHQCSCKAATFSVNYSIHLYYFMTSQLIRSLYTNVTNLDMCVVSTISSYDISSVDWSFIYKRDIPWCVCVFSVLYPRITYPQLTGPPFTNVTNLGVCVC